MQTDQTRAPSRRLPATLLVAAALHALALPAPGDDAPVFDARIDLHRVDPKARIRDGTPGLAGDSVFSGPDLDTDRAVPALSLEVGVRLDAHRLSLGGWWLDAGGSGRFDETKAVGGTIVPAGTPVDSTLSWTSVRLRYRYRIPLVGRSDGSDRSDLSDPSDHYLALDLGAAVDRTTFRSEMEFPGVTETTSLRGIFPTPLVGADIRPFGSGVLAIRAEAGGFNFLRIPNGDTTVLDPLEYRLAVRVAWRQFHAEAGYRLYHVHLERDRNDPEEDVVHMRLRSFYIGAGMSF
jgi:hypothetical protein